MPMGPCFPPWGNGCSPCTDLGPHHLLVALRELFRHWIDQNTGPGPTLTCPESHSVRVLGAGFRGPCSPFGSGFSEPSRATGGVKVAGWGGACPAGGTLTPPLLAPAGSGGLTPSPLACGPCCWGCTWLSSTCRLCRPAGWTPSSSAPRPCAAWWASRRLWPQGRQQAHGGSGPEGQRNSSDGGGRTDGWTGPELCP